MTVHRTIGRMIAGMTFVLLLDAAAPVAAQTYDCLEC